MQKKLSLLDTSIIVRFLTGDDKELADRAEKLFQEAENSSLEIPDLVVAETVYVLLSFYKFSKEEVIEKIDLLLDFEKFKTNKKVFKKTLEFFKENNISFVDAYLSALVSLSKNQKLYTFDKNLEKMANKP